MFCLVNVSVFFDDLTHPNDKILMFPCHEYIVQEELIEVFYLRLAEHLVANEVRVIRPLILSYAFQKT